MNVITVLLGTLLTLSLVFVGRWGTTLLRARREGWPENERLGMPRPIHLAIGFVTNFFDALGIGSFATTTTIYRLFGLVPDERIPATMIAGHALPVVFQAFVSITVVQVDRTMLALLILASIAGGWLGAGVVSRLPRHAIQLGMGVALLAAASFMTVGMLGWFPVGGTALALGGWKLGIALVASFLLGALLTLGIGNYGPSLVLFSLLGLNPRAAFPIMMGSGAFVAVAAGIRYVIKGRYDARAALGLCLGGLPGVAVAVWLVTSLPLDLVRQIVVVVVVYTAVSMLRSAATDLRRVRRGVGTGPAEATAPRSM